MSNESEKMLLVGDNPFHGISHLSQERARVRGDAITHAEHAANLVTTSIENGASGFMFSVSDTTLSILEEVREMQKSEPLDLYALVPYAYEYVRLATHMGGVSGLAKKIAKEIVLSGNVRAIAMGLKGAVGTDPVALLKAYLYYEISRIESSAGKKTILKSVMLHEIVTDMALALNLDWLLKAHIVFMSKRGIKPGFETRNFVFLANKFKEWSIDFEKIAIAAPFNKVGFQMNPSKDECEKALANLPETEVLAISVLAAGYLKPLEASKYLQTLPNLKGVVVGVSKETQARETFRLLKENLI